MNARNKILLGYPFFFAALCLFFVFRLDFQQLHNDFWDVYFVARHLAWADKHTWFNPQYPIGYDLFLKGIAGNALPVAPAILANIFFTFTILFIAMRFYREMLTPGFALVSLVALSIFPQFFQYATVGGGDPGSMAFFTAGAMLVLYALYHFPEQSKNKFFLIAGILLGFGALFRYHVLVADGLFVIAAWIVFPRRWKSLAWVSAGVCLAYSPQWMVNIATGHGLLKTQFGSMNVYDLMYGLNFYRTTDLNLPSSIHLIGSDPVLFLKQYLHAFWSYKQVYLPAIFASLFEADPRHKKIARIVAIWILIYFLFFSAVTSGRQILLPLPFSFLCFGMMLRILWRKLAKIPVFSNANVRASLGAIVLMLMALLSLHRNSIIQNKRVLERDVCKFVEARLTQQEIASSKQVFTNDYDLYFRTLPPYVPYFNGGVSRWGTYLYNEEFPEFPVGSPEEFVAVCRNRGVRFIVLNSDCRRLSDTMGDLYEGRIEIEGLELESETGDVRIYRVT